MTYYEQHIKPVMEEHPDWQALTQQIADAQAERDQHAQAMRVRIEQLEKTRMNFEARFISTFANGPSP